MSESSSSSSSFSKLHAPMDQFNNNNNNTTANNHNQEPHSIRFNPPSIIRDSAFSKPLLPSSSSLLKSPPKPPIFNGSSPDPNPLNPLSPNPARYRECLKNHAAALGGHVIDGCGEFMPSPSDPLKCAACNCHRSFHRKEPEPEPLPNNPKSSSPYRVPLLLPSPNLNPLTDQSSSEERAHTPNTNSHHHHHSYGEQGRKKRFRTKFSSDQKEKMRSFAERVGWRVQKKDEGEMERFCSEVGVSRQVLKVWMHNNKHLVRRSAESKGDDDDNGERGLV